MSLQIYAYTDLRKLDIAHDPDDDLPEETMQVLVNPHFPGRADELEDGAIYAFTTCEKCLDLSYGGYNDFRNELAGLAGYPQAMHSSKRQFRHDAGAWLQSSGPFWELINFADNEGCIGPRVCAKLAKDFGEFQSKAERLFPVGYFLETYNKLRAGVEAAANGNGCLEFT